MELLIVLVLTLVVAVLVTYMITPFIIKRMKMRGIVGKDMNKLGKPTVSEMGGISVIFGFSIAIMFAIFCFQYLNLFELNLTALLAGFSTIVLIGFLGIVDDLIGWKQGIRQWQHALFPLFAALPLMAFKVGTTEMLIPFIGVVSFGIFYSLILVPIGVAGAANAFNMLAGLNGLETGIGIIATATLLIVGWVYGAVEVVIILAAILGALIAFMKFNWHPAKIFPGDSLTLMVGASVAVAAILGNMEKIGIIVVGLLFIELIFKARRKFQSECFGVPQKDGTLAAPSKVAGSITHWVMKRGKFTEKQVVMRILVLQLVFSILAILVFLLNHFSIVMI